jgi:hypothetical protein
MTTKSKSKSKAKTKTAPKKLDNAAFDAAIASFRTVTPSAADRRKELLAQVAGSIAGHIISSPPNAPEVESSMAASIATIAVDVAEEILKKSGIPPIVASAESVSSSPAPHDGVSTSS